MLASTDNKSKLIYEAIGTSELSHYLLARPGRVIAVHSDGRALYHRDVPPCHVEALIVCPGLYAASAGPIDEMIWCRFEYHELDGGYWTRCCEFAPWHWLTKKWLCYGEVVRQWCRDEGDDAKKAAGILAARILVQHGYANHETTAAFQSVQARLRTCTKGMRSTHMREEWEILEKFEKDFCNGNRS